MGTSDIRYQKQGVLLCIFTLFLCLISEHLVEAQTRVHIVYTGYVQGELFASNSSTSLDCYDEDPSVELDSPCVGGCHRRADYISSSREADPDTIVVEAGGYYWGSLFYTFYGVSPAVACIKNTDYDLMIFGGTDLYGGTTSLLSYLEQTALSSTDSSSTGLPMVSTNLDVSANATWSQYFLPYHIHTTPGGVKVGFVSLLDDYFKTTTTLSTMDWFTINPTYSAYNYIRRAISSMRAEAGTDLKIVLVVEENRARQSIDDLLDIEFVNIILVRRPQTIVSGIFTNIYDEYVYVSTVGTSYGYDRYIADIDLTFETNGTITLNYVTPDSGLELSSPVVNGTSNSVWLAMDPFNPLDNAEFQRVVATLPTDDTGAVIPVDGREGDRARNCDDALAAVGFSPDSWGCRSGECPMGNLLVNSLLYNCESIGMVCDIAALNAGSIIDSLTTESISVSDVNKVLPYSNVITSFDLTGTQVMRMLANSVADSHSGRFLQSNIRFVYYPVPVRMYEITSNCTAYLSSFVGADECSDESITAGLTRIMDVQLQVNGVWTDIDETSTYRVVSNTYMYEGGDCFTMLKDSDTDNAKDHSITLQDAFINYLESFADTDSSTFVASSGATKRPIIEDPVPTATSDMTVASTIPNSLIRTFATYASCLFDTSGTRVVPPIADSSFCLNAFTDQLESEYNSCPSDNDFCLSHVNNTFSDVYSNSVCDADTTECSGYGVCTNKKCVCTISEGTENEVIEGVPTYGEFAGIEMISGTMCSVIRSEWSLKTGEQVAMYIAGALSFIVALFWMILLFMYRNKPVIKASSPIFSLIMCFGAMIGAVSIFFDAQTTSIDFCNASLCFILVGYVILFSAVFVKTHRIDHIFNSKLLKNKTKYTDLRVLVNICAFLVIELILLGLFRGIAPLEPKASALTSSNEYAMLCATDSTIFTALLFVFNGLLMFWGVYLAVRTRNVDSNFNESKHIGAAIYNCAFSGLIMILVMYVIVDSNPTIAYLIKAWLVAYIIICTLTIMFLPRFRLLYAGSDGRTGVTTDRSVVGDLEKQAQRDKRTIQFLVQKMKERDMYMLERDEAIASLQTFIRTEKLTPPEIKVTPVDITPPANNGSSNSDDKNPPSNQSMTPSGAPKKPLFANRMTIGGHRNSVLSSAPRPIVLQSNPPSTPSNTSSSGLPSANSGAPLNPPHKLTSPHSESDVTHIQYTSVLPSPPSSSAGAPPVSKSVEMSTFRG